MDLWCIFGLKFGYDFIQNISWKEFQYHFHGWWIFKMSFRYSFLPSHSKCSTLYLICMVYEDEDRETERQAKYFPIRKFKFSYAFQGLIENVNRLKIGEYVTWVFYDSLTCLLLVVDIFIPRFSCFSFFGYFKINKYGDWRSWLIRRACIHSNSFMFLFSHDLFTPRTVHEPNLYEAQESCCIHTIFFSRLSVRFGIMKEKKKSSISIDAVVVSTFNVFISIMQ